jgi:hypothetical protein
MRMRHFPSLPQVPQKEAWCLRNQQPTPTMSLLFRGLLELGVADLAGLPLLLIFCSCTGQLVSLTFTTNFYSAEGAELARPAILACYPASRRSEYDSKRLWEFIYAEGFSLQARSAADRTTPEQPAFFSCALSSAEGENELQLYFGCYRTWEAVSSVDAAGNVLYEPRIRCLCATRPVLSLFHQHLLHMRSSGACKFFRDAVLYYKRVLEPVLESLDVSVMTHLPDDDMSVAVPAPPQLPPTADHPATAVAEYHPLPSSEDLLRKHFDDEGLLIVVLSLLMERKVVLLAPDASILLPLCEALRRLLHPFQFLGTYIPLLPASLAAFLEAPTPYLIGSVGKWLGERTEVLERAKENEVSLCLMLFSLPSRLIFYVLSILGSGGRPRHEAGHSALLRSALSSAALRSL